MEKLSNCVHPLEAITELSRVSTGVKGLDEMLNGGLPQGRCLLVCGGPGSGKTIFGFQYLYAGITNHGETGLYVALDESPAHLKQNLASFGWNIEKSEKDEKLAIIDASPIRLMPGEVKIGNISVGKRDFDLVALMETIKQKAEKLEVKRIVIDPITALTLQYDNISERRTAILDLFEALQKLGTTTLITTELRSVTLEREICTEEFLAHGVIVLHVFVNNGQIIRGIQIEKMRGIAHDTQIRPYDITGKGISVFPQESLMHPTVSTPPGTVA